MTELTERVARLEGAYDHLATKADIAELKAATQADIAELKQVLSTELSAKIGTVEKEIAELKGSAKTLALAISVGLVAVQIILKYALP